MAKATGKDPISIRVKAELIEIHPNTTPIQYENELATVHGNRAHVTRIMKMRTPYDNA